MRRALALLAALIASSTLGGCSIIANRLAVATTVVRCAAGSAPGGDRNFYRAAIAACTNLIDSKSIKGRSLYLILVYRGDAYLATRAFAKALTDFNSAFLVEPFNSLALVGQSQADVHLGRRIEALQAADEAVGIHPTATTYENRASVRDYYGKFAAAIADYSRMIAIDANDANAYNDRCWERAKGGLEFEKALADCNVALAKRPGEPATLNSRGYLFYRMGSYVLATADINASMKDQPNFASSLYIRGLIEAKMGDKKAASKDEAAAVALSPQIATSVVP